MNRRLSFYRALLRVYPKAYREQYGPQMVQTLEDMLSDAPTLAGKVAVWIRTVGKDVPLSATKQQVAHIGSLALMPAPPYVKRNAILSAVLLVPFLLALIANGIDRLVYGKDLYHSWLWHTPVLATWVLYLPASSALIALASLLYFELDQARKGRLHWRQTLSDVRYHWPLLGVALVGLFILAVVFGHDSVHCVMGSPVSEAQHVQQTWQCILQGKGK